MNIGGGLSYVTGPMGAGKTFFGVRRIVGAVCRHQYAVTNIELAPDWAERVARHLARTAAKRKRARIADRLRGFYVYCEELDEATRYRLPGSGESRGLFVWDESHNDLNNRRWKDDGRGDVLTWATQLRKLGFEGYLLSQHHENTDAQLRRVCNYLIRLQNQREQTRMFGLRVTPWPLFLASWYPAHVPLNTDRKGRSIVKVERYFLTWMRHLYDTHGVYHGVGVVEDAGRTILLPAGGLPAARSVPPAGGAVQPA